MPLRLLITTCAAILTILVLFALATITILAFLLSPLTTGLDTLNHLLHPPPAHTLTPPSLPDTPEGTPGALDGAPTPAALADIPTDYLALYHHAAATCPGLPWSVLAGIGKTESDHGRSTLPGVHTGHNPLGAQGPMQFLPPTFTRYATNLPPGGTTPPSPFNPSDAIHTAAHLLCANGARDNTNLPAAILTYNHSTTYLHQVLTKAHQYTQTTPNTPTLCNPARRPPPNRHPCPR